MSPMMKRDPSINEACRQCKGACCETIALPLPRDEVAVEWISVRGKVEGNTIRLYSPCPKLGVNGECTVHLTKPRVCAEYQVGGPACIAAIRANRSYESHRLVALAKKHQTGGQS